jgi:hypothetical protein
MLLQWILTKKFSISMYAIGWRAQHSTSLDLLVRPYLKLLKQTIAMSHLFIGFDYHFNAIQEETDELFLAYRDMFETTIAQSQSSRSLLCMIVPLLNKFMVMMPFISSFEKALTLKSARCIYEIDCEGARSHRTYCAQAYSREEKTNRRGQRKWR